MYCPRINDLVPRCFQVCCCACHPTFLRKLRMHLMSHCCEDNSSTDVAICSLWSPGCLCVWGNIQHSLGSMQLNVELPELDSKNNKSSAVAEMGDRGHNRHGPKRGGLLCSFCEGWEGVAGSPSNSVAWAEAYLPTKWHLDPSSHLSTTGMGQKLGAPPPFGGGGAGSSNTIWPGLRPTCMPSFILIHPTIWPQYTNITDRQTMV